MTIRKRGCVRVGREETTARTLASDRSCGRGGSWPLCAEKRHGPWDPLGRETETGNPARRRAGKQEPVSLCRTPTWP
ncbi:unnamed protein product [Caretta caretta]